MCNFTITKGTSEDANNIGELIYSTEKHPQGEWGEGSKEELISRLHCMILRDDNRFSLENIWVLKVDNIFAGIVLALEGNKLKYLTFKADRSLIKMQKSIKDKLKFFVLTLGYLLDKECSRDEFYISNIAIKKEFRGRGLSRIFLDEIYKEAALRGFNKVSLRANNEKLINFYSKLGFNLVKSTDDKMIQLI